MTQQLDLVYKMSYIIIQEVEVMLHEILDILGGLVALLLCYVFPLYVGYRIYRRLVSDLMRILGRQVEQPKTPVAPSHRPKLEGIFFR
jgi:hypothetical protein